MLVESGEGSLQTVGINNGMSYAITNQQRFKNLDKGKNFELKSIMDFYFVFGLYLLQAILINTSNLIGCIQG